MNLRWNKNNDGQRIAEKANNSDHWKENSFHQPKADKICELSTKDQTINNPPFELSPFQNVISTPAIQTSVK